jgi:serine/threonine protein phosphatase 1
VQDAGIFGDFPGCFGYDCGKGGHPAALTPVLDNDGIMSVSTTISDWMRAPVILNGPDEFAIGDSHGCLDLLESMIEAMASNAPPGSNLTCLGDLIDRGPDSLGCLSLMSRPATDLGFSENHVLFGNHELMMLGAMRFEKYSQLDAFRLWTDNGGWAAMESFGMVEEEYDAFGWLKLEEPIRTSLGEAAHLLDQLETHRRVGNLLFVHAGINPSIKLANWFTGNPLRTVINEDQHFAWIRFPFLGHDGRFEDDLIVVHGHTPEDTVMSWKGRRGVELHRLDGWRLGLDGGSYRTGRIAGAQFRKDEYRVFVASRSS